MSYVPSVHLSVQEPSSTIYNQISKKIQKKQLNKKEWTYLKLI